MSAGFVPILFLVLAIVVDAAARYFAAHGENVLGRALQLVAYFLLIAGAVSFGILWSHLR